MTQKKKKKKTGTRAFKEKVINIPIYHPKNVFESEENNNAFWAKCCLCNTDRLAAMASQMIDRSTK